MHQRHLHQEYPGMVTWPCSVCTITQCVPCSQMVTIYLACDSKELVSVLYTDTVLEVLDKLSDKLASSESVLWVVDNRGRGKNMCTSNSISMCVCVMVNVNSLWKVCVHIYICLFY